MIQVLNGIKYVELKPDRPFMYDMLEKPVHSKQKGDHFGYGWCGGLCRWGTRDKLNALDRYAKDNNAIVYIGIAADEPKRLERMEDFKRAPLAEWGVIESVGIMEFTGQKMVLIYIVSWIEFLAGVVAIRIRRSSIISGYIYLNIGND